MNTEAKRSTIAVDFDGVIHSYTSPWKAAHIIPDPPVKGAIEWLFEMIQTFDVVIFSTRCKSLRGRMAMRRWLSKYAGNLWYESPAGSGLEDVRLSYTKPPAIVYLDDRAMRFEGNFPTADDIHRAHPWNKKKHYPQRCKHGVHLDEKCDKCASYDRGMRHFPQNPRRG